LLKQVRMNEFNAFRTTLESNDTKSCEDINANSENNENLSGSNDFILINSNSTENDSIIKLPRPNFQINQYQNYDLEPIEQINKVENFIENSIDDKQDIFIPHDLTEDLETAFFEPKPDGCVRLVINYKK
jgi:hypothetical protein